ncbi:MAG: flagellar biosynthesis protein FlhF [Clostridiales bacterium]|jgi:flagellar biosynthesis protein FlhF|nr:flagellar biosynthesis protein FlhF [Clostridiales bacterium]
MLVKRYRAKDMQEAMDTVIKELGSDAVLLNSRKVRKKGLRYLFQRPLQEVMVAYDPAKIPIAKKINRTYSAYAPKLLNDGGNEINALKATELNREQMEGLDSRIDSLDRMLNGFIDKFSFVKRDITYDYTSEVEALLTVLINNQVRDELAHQIAKEAEEILKKQQGAKARDVIEHLILEKLGTPEPIRLKKYNRRIVLVVGPTGVGKTTTIVKLAAELSIKQKKKVGIINTDTYRIAAQEQLKTYSDILDIPLSVVYQVSEIGQTINDMPDREVVFIDTAGKCPGNLQHKEDIKAIMECAAPEEVLLCVSATTSFPALKEILDSYEYIDNFKLLITKLDETKYRGMILNLCWYTKKMLAYVTTGQNVPDDIEQADTLSITNHLLRE